MYATRRTTKRLFQLALPRRERLKIFIRLNLNIRCFNSRSREGSDKTSFEIDTTNVGFNSRSREGSDRPAPHSIRRDFRFNSRSREGSD